jgi:hypothetical protein
MSTELEPVTGSRQLPTLRESRPDAVPADDCDPARTLPILAATATRRAQWLSDRLAEAVQRDGLHALVDDQWGVDGQGNAVRLGEQVRALVTLEGAERDRAAHLSLQLAKLGLDISSARSAAVAKQARQMVTLAQALCEEVGLDWADDATRRIAQRAVLRASERQVNERQVEEGTRR